MEFDLFCTDSCNTVTLLEGVEDDGQTKQRQTEESAFYLGRYPNCIAWHLVYIFSRMANKHGFIWKPKRHTLK